MRSRISDELNTQVDYPEFFVYVMGPYTTIDLSYYLDDDATIGEEDTDFGAFDPDDKMKEVLKEVVSMIRNRIGVNAFIATEIDIPTPSRAADDEEAMDALTQSIKFADVSNAVVFILPHGGLRDGVDVEIGSVLENNIIDANESAKEERYRVFIEKHVSSTTLESTGQRYDVVFDEFETRTELERQLRQFIFETIGREESGDLNKL